MTNRGFNDFVMQRNGLLNVGVVLIVVGVILNVLFHIDFVRFDRLLQSRWHCFVQPIPSDNQTSSGTHYPMKGILLWQR